MGLFDLLRPEREETQRTASALEAARTGQQDDGAIARLVQMLLDSGIDGRGPLSSATTVATRASRRKADTHDAIQRVMRTHVTGATIGGFITGLGGFVTMPVALPVNVAEFYVQATRMVAAIATLRGYDVNDPQVRSAVLLTLVGSRADDVLRKAGVTSPTGALTRAALRPLPPPALMMVNKAVGFRLMRGVGERVFASFGRGIPLLGGVLGAVLDAWMMTKVAEQALLEFPEHPAG